MNITNRVRVIHLIEKIRRNPDYARKLGVSVNYRINTNDETGVIHDRRYKNGKWCC